MVQSWSTKRFFTNTSHVNVNRVPVTNKNPATAIFQYISC